MFQQNKPISFSPDVKHGKCANGLWADKCYTNLRSGYDRIFSNTKVD